MSKLFFKSFFKLNHKTEQILVSQTFLMNHKTGLNDWSDLCKIKIILSQIFLFSHKIGLNDLSEFINHSFEPDVYIES